MLRTAASSFAGHLGAALVSESSTLDAGPASISRLCRDRARPDPWSAWTVALRCSSLRESAALVANVELLEGEATAMPVERDIRRSGLRAGFDYVQDVDAALVELHRALRPGGHAVVWDIDWATVSIRRGTLL